MKAERRRHTRCPVWDDEFEVFNQDSKIIGRLNNISRGGLSFQYSPAEGRRAKSGTYDIMAKTPDPFYLPSLACRAIYDIGALAEDRTFTGAASRLCGMEFIGLNRGQKQKLVLFIRKYGPEPSEDNG